MGTGDDAVVRVVTAAETLPGHDEIELALFGPGYGESVVMHIGQQFPLRRPYFQEVRRESKVTNGQAAAT